ncbi:DpnI domain-containing protein [Maricaulis sp.]|uniref:DpnI domain-containing protein n=1 Tax=Maricaulis sp. TaxID=1486257 RepID=UPI003A95D268
MKLEFRETQAPYVSGTQAARWWTEDWASNELFCPSCGGESLTGYENNRPVADLFCENCAEQFELKSSKKTFGFKIVDGAYSSMSERLASTTNPNLFLLNYDLDRRSITNLIVVPKQFFTLSVIERRPPLKPTARRAGWVGCNILFGKIPATGRIEIVRNGAVRPRERVVQQWRRTLFLRSGTASSRGWLLEVLGCVERLGSEEFSTDDAYRFAPYLQEIFPKNRHVREKIRQQLQRLRDNGILEFVARGRYRLIPG